MTKIAAPYLHPAMDTAISIPLLCCLGVTLSAQNYTVSPAVNARLEAESNNTWPWTGVFRYQQIYTDLGGTAKVLSGLAWRRNQDQFLPTGNPTRALDMEIWTCDGNATTFTTTFANNYIGTPVNTFLRKVVNTPDWRLPIVQRPGPFDWFVLNDVPYVYLGVNDLIYEILMHSSSSGSTFMCDSAVTTPSTSAPAYGTYTSVGSGCATTLGTFSLRSQIQRSPTSVISFAWDVFAGPASAPGAVLLGLAPLNVAISGLCTNLYTDGGLLSIPFTTSATGAATTAALTAPYDPAWSSLVISAQAAAADASQPFFMPLAATQGTRCEVPPALPAARGYRLWAFTTSALTGTLSNASWLVTQFRH